MNALAIKLLPGKVAPKYTEGKELECNEVIITEQGTVGGFPILDFKMRDEAGNFYLLVLSGRMINAISAAVKGVNVRNHGREEP